MDESEIQEVERFRNNLRRQGLNLRIASDICLGFTTPKELLKEWIKFTLEELD
jgi:hypothetical protein